jgi:hypothetical protein
VVIVDTTVWVDYLNGIATPHTDWLDRQDDFPAAHAFNERARP